MFLSDRSSCALSVVEPTCFGRVTGMGMGRRASEAMLTIGGGAMKKEPKVHTFVLDGERVPVRGL